MIVRLVANRDASTVRPIGYHIRGKDLAAVISGICMYDGPNIQIDIETNDPELMSQLMPFAVFVEEVAPALTDEQINDLILRGNPAVSMGLMQARSVPPDEFSAFAKNVDKMAAYCGAPVCPHCGGALAP